MKFAFDAARTLSFSREARSVFDQYRSKSNTEAGGILLGRLYPSSVEIEIATEPSRADRAGRFFFERSTRVAQDIVNKAWETSEGQQIYLGEWHSHPAAVAVPSGRDRAMILNNLRDAKMEIDFLFLVVVGQREDFVGVATADGLRRLERLPA